MQFYIIVRSFSNNHRNELKKAFKVFFLDLGIRNVIIDNLDPLKNREDKGVIFEMVSFSKFKKLYPQAMTTVVSLEDLV